MPNPRIRTMSDRGRSWLVALEGGSKLRAYRDSIGVWTIGPGLTTLFNPPRRVAESDRFDSQLSAMTEFARQLKRYEALVDAAMRDDITQIEFDAFTSLAWNCEAAMKGSTLVRRFNAYAPLSAVVAELQRWNRAAGQIDRGLVERRQCEADLLLYGVYRTQGEKIIRR